MNRTPVLKAREIVAALRKAGFVVSIKQGATPDCDAKELLRRS